MRLLIACVSVGLATFPAPAFAVDLKVTSEPAGAAVQLDGVACGTSPVVIPKVSAGPHELKITANGYTPRIDTLQVDGDREMQIHAPLEPLPKVADSPPPLPIPPPPIAPPPPVQTSAPPSPPDQLPSPAPLAVPPPPAAPSPSVQASGIPNLGSEQPREARAPLPVSELPVAWGTQRKTFSLVVETVPPGALVQVVGMPEVKRAPTTFTGFAAGTLQLLVRAPGYWDRRVAVDITSDARTRVELEPIR